MKEFCLELLKRLSGIRGVEVAGVCFSDRSCLTLGASASSSQCEPIWRMVQEALRLCEMHNLVTRDISWNYPRHSVRGLRSIKTKTVLAVIYVKDMAAESLEELNARFHEFQLFEGQA